MKKYLIIFLSIFSVFFITDNVNALTFNKCNTTITVDNTNYMYYLYDKYKSNFESKSNKQFVFFINSDNTYYHFRIFNDSTTINFNNSIKWNSKAIQYTSTDYFGYYVNKSNGTAYYVSPNNSASLAYLSLYTSYTNSNYTYTEIDRNNNSTVVNYTANISLQDLQQYFMCNQSYTITYYLNNEVYDSFIVEGGTSHTLLYYEPSIEYEFSGWSYDSNIDLTNIQSDINIYGTTTLKPYYNITYYLNENMYYTTSVIKGTNYTIQDYTPPKYYTFSGWSYDSNIDLTNITSNVNIYGTTTYVRPTLEYSEEVDSVIHNITLSIVGEGVPQEFDFVYQIFDFLVLLVLVLTVLSPFIILFKLLGVI